MRIRILLATYFLLFIPVRAEEESQDWHDFWDEAGSTWYDKWDKTLKSLDRFSKSERIEILASASKIRNLDQTPQQDEIAKRAQKTLMDIPGHARYFTNLLEQKKQDMLANKVSYHEYTLAQEALSVLAYLPSPETVTELGKLISDPIGRDGKLLGGGDVWEGDGWFPVNCQIALRCFDALPIENGPKLTNDDFGAENFSGVDKWKDWWEEVKAGKRTYRFKGSPIEYGPDGPVSTKELEGRQHDRQRDNVSAGTSGSKKQEENTPANLDSRWRWAAWLGTAMASILLLIAASKVFRKPSRG